jgi:hypothetical protein
MRLNTSRCAYGLAALNQDRAWPQKAATYVAAARPAEKGRACGNEDEGYCLIVLLRFSFSPLV